MPAGDHRTFEGDGAPLRVDVSWDGGRRVDLVASGELDHFSAPTLARALAAAEQGSGGDVVVDLAGLTFCDAGGVACFLEGWHRLRAQGRTLCLVRPTRSVARLLSLAGAEHLLG
jgi:anti-anti-sigma factor